MSKLPVALQLYSIRDAAEQDFKGTIKAIKQMGYNGVEFAGLYGIAPGEVKAILDENGVKAVSAHVPLHELKADPNGVIDTYAGLGCPYIAIPYLSEDDRPGGPNFQQTLADIEAIGKQCAQKGVTLLYHNHEFEFDLLPDGRTGLDTMYQAVGADVLATQLDTCWVKVAGYSPVDYIKTYAGRCPLVHVKDFYKEGLTGTPYQLLGAETEQQKDPGHFEYRPLGRGMQDIPAILEAAVSCGADWVIVEQDEADNPPPMEAAKISRDYLKTLGW